MIKTVDNPHGISLEIIDLIHSGKAFTLILNKGKITYEICFYPMSSDMDQGIQIYEQEKNDYAVIETKDGTLHRLIEKHPMVETSTINNAIYRTIKALELNGYKLAPSTNWKVI